jgi:hypothetical protein
VERFERDRWARAGRAPEPGPFLDAFAAAGVTNLASADARALLAIAPIPADGATLTHARIADALRRGGRQRNINRLGAQLREALRRRQLRQPALVEQAMGTQTLALLAALNAACDGIDQLAEAIGEYFRQHPDYTVITSFPGLADITGARVLAEIGDDRARFVDARALNAYAGSAPVTRASRRSHVVTHRRIKNDRLAAVGYTWAFMAMTTRQKPEPITSAARPTAIATPPPPTPVQPHARPALPLPANPPNLQPDQGIRRSLQPHQTDRRLTSGAIGGLREPRTVAQLPRAHADPAGTGPRVL